MADLGRVNATMGYHVKLFCFVPPLRMRPGGGNARTFSEDLGVLVVGGSGRTCRNERSCSGHNKMLRREGCLCLFNLHIESPSNLETTSYNHLHHFTEHHSFPISSHFKSCQY
jgi:hypothetical protein